MELTEQQLSEKKEWAQRRLAYRAKKQLERAGLTLQELALIPNACAVIGSILLGILLLSVTCQPAHKD